MPVYIFVSLTQIIWFLTFIGEQKCRDRIYLKNKTKMFVLLKN